jgi:hypothetical protein
MSCPHGELVAVRRAHREAMGAIVFQQPASEHRIERRGEYHGAHAGQPGPAPSMRENSSSAHRHLSLPRHNHPLQLRLRTAAPVPIFEDDDTKSAPPIAAFFPQPKRRIGCDAL